VPDAGVSLFFPSGARDELAAAIGTNEVHLLGTIAAKSAFVAADQRCRAGLQPTAALFAFFFHFQGHIARSGSIL
jgi:hypothetical protein